MNLLLKGRHTLSVEDYFSNIQMNFMQPTYKPRIKICCISSKQEAQLAVSYGASALGLVSAMPSGPGVIEEALIAEIAETIPPAVASFLLTSQQAPEVIIE